jgi:hypothetical protein
MKPESGNQEIELGMECPSEHVSVKILYIRICGIRFMQGFKRKMRAEKFHHGTLACANVA